MTNYTKRTVVQGSTNLVPLQGNALTPSGLKAGAPRALRAGGETVHPPLPPPSRPPVHRARRPRVRSTTDAADASLCSPLSMVFVSVPPPESRDGRPAR